MDKVSLRKQVRAKIRSLDPDYMQSSDEGILSNVIALPEYKSAKTIFAYFSVKGEADTHKLISHSLEVGKRVALPIVRGDGIMVFAEAEGKLVEGMSYGIPEPDENSELIEPMAGDVIIVPALCFDENCYRLGQGGGFYDRYLEKYPSLYKIGLCRETLIMGDVPRESHDMGVNIVVTEKRTARS